MGGGGGGRNKKMSREKAAESEEAADANLQPSGDLFLLDGISRKLVITPEYDIGHKRMPASSGTMDLPMMVDGEEVGEGEGEGGGMDVGIMAMGHSDDEVEEA